MSVNLQKGQRVSLDKATTGADLASVIMGLGWDVARGAAAIDLDASCLCFDGNKRLLENVYFGRLQNSSNSIRHSGDNLTGAGDGDDETITVDLGKVPVEVQQLVFTVNSFRGQKFSTVENAKVRLLNGAGKAELFVYNLSSKGEHTGMIMCRLYRHNGGWKLNAIGETCNGRTAQELVPAIQALI